MLAIMDQSKTTLERAFELARSGSVSNLAELRAAIKMEGYASGQINGPVLSRQLRGLIDKSREADTHRT
jgi:hypothetical protein